MKATCRTLDCQNEYDLELDVKEYPEAIVTNEAGNTHIYRHLNRGRREQGYYIEVDFVKIDTEQTRINYREAK